MSFLLEVDLLQVQSFIRIKKSDEGQKIFDFVRKKWLTLQPEEWIRQLTVLYLSKVCHYPLNRFSIERSVSKGLRKGRWDLVVYDFKMNPFILIECKAPHVSISDSVLFQASIYNIEFKAPFIGLTNGSSFCCMQVNRENNNQSFLKEFPAYPTILS